MLKGSKHTEASRALISAKSAKAGGRRQTIFHEGHTTTRGSCKECQVRQQKTYQDRNRDRINAASRAKASERLDRCVAYLGGHCVDCGYMANRDGLEFDHVPGRGPKAFSITALLNTPWNALVAELDKCDLVCGTCHNIRTARRRNAKVAARRAT